jgi:hypothetical protein
MSRVTGGAKTLLSRLEWEAYSVCSFFWWFRFRLGGLNQVGVASLSPTIIRGRSAGSPPICSRTALNHALVRRIIGASTIRGLDPFSAFGGSGLTVNHPVLVKRAHHFMKLVQIERFG